MRIRGLSPASVPPAGLDSTPQQVLVSFDEDEVLRVARDQFWSTGNAAARVDDIAAATGLGKGSLYGAFGDKHQLFLRTFDDHCAALTEAVLRGIEALGKGGSSPDSLRAIAETALALLPPY
jgi:AcrR family transcriptional regulator